MWGFNYTVLSLLELRSPRCISSIPLTISPSYRCFAQEHWRLSLWTEPAQPIGRPKQNHCDSALDFFSGTRFRTPKWLMRNSWRSCRRRQISATSSPNLLTCGSSRTELAMISRKCCSPACSVGSHVVPLTLKWWVSGFFFSEDCEVGSKCYIWITLGIHREKNLCCTWCWHHCGGKRRQSAVLTCSDNVDKLISLLLITYTYRLLQHTNLKCFTRTGRIKNIAFF